MRTSQKGFTLVELIVVITILAILGTIAFISLQGYSQDARDSKVVSDVRSLTSAVETQLTSGTSVLNLVTDAGDDVRDITGVSGTDYTGAGTFAGTLALSGATIQTGDINFATLRQNASDFGASTYKMAAMTHVVNAGTPSSEAFNMYQIVGAQGTSPNQTAVVRGNFLPGTGANAIAGLMAGSGATAAATGLTEGTVLPNGL